MASETDGAGGAGAYLWTICVFVSFTGFAVVQDVVEYIDNIVFFFRNSAINLSPLSPCL